MLKKTVRHPRHLALSALTVAMFSGYAQADTPFDIKLSYYDTAANANARKAAIEANINNFAEALYEATNGAHKLRNVTIYANGAFKDDTDIQWVNKCHPNAHVNGRGTAGMRIEHCDNFSDSQDYLVSTMWGGYTLMHEWGHFTYGLFDEYRNESKDCNAEQPGGPCKNDTPVPNSLMHQQDNAGNAENVMQDVSWLNFSTPLNNTKNTAQFRVYGLSGWETLVRDSAQDSEAVVTNTNGIRRKFYEDLLAVAPKAGQAPSIEITNEDQRAKAKSLLNFIWKTDSTTPSDPKTQNADISGSGASLAIAKQIVIERSANISARVLEEVKAAVQLVVEQAGIGDTIGIIAFDNTATQVLAPTKITDEDARTKVLNAIKSIQVSQQPAALGDALSKALAGLKAANLSTSTVSSVYLFADGFSPAGTVTPLSQVDAYQKSDVSLFSFGLSADFAVNTLLKQLAQKTRGDFYLAVKNNVLVKAIQQTESRMSPNVDVTLAQDTSSISNGQSLPFYVDSTLSGVEVVVSYTGQKTGNTFTVIDPSGKSTPMSTNDCVSEEDEDPNAATHSCTLKIQDAAEGSWKIQLTRADAAPLSVFYSVSGDPKDNNSAVAASANASDAIASVGSKILLTSKVEQDFPITDLKVTGKLVKPDDSTVSLEWRDDGVKPDRKARDGIYSAEITASTEGAYYASVNFDNLQNTGKASNESTIYVGAQVNAGPGDFLKTVNLKFNRAAETDVIASQLLGSNGSLTDYERVMNWGEAVVAPSVLPVKGKQVMDIDVYKVRYYPESKTYLGLNKNDNNMYIYNPALFGKDIVLLGPLADFLSRAKQDGF